MQAIDQLIDQLSDYRSRFPDESMTVDTFVEFLTRNGFASFERALDEGHITASCWLLDRRQTHVLLTHHRKLNCWIQLGGHADGETDPVKVALTEASEESGIDGFELLFDGALFDIDRHTIPARRNEPEHFHYDLRFAMRTVTTDDYVISRESHDLCWVDITQISEFTNDESVIRMARKWLSMSKL